MHFHVGPGLHALLQIWYRFWNNFVILISWLIWRNLYIFPRICAFEFRACVATSRKLKEQNSRFRHIQNASNFNCRHFLDDVSISSFMFKVEIWLVLLHTLHELIATNSKQEVGKKKPSGSSTVEARFCGKIGHRNLVHRSEIFRYFEQVCVWKIRIGYPNFLKIVLELRFSAKSMSTK